VTYDRPKGLLEQILSLEAKSPDHVLSSDTLGSVLTPRLWYLTPGYELGTFSTSSSPAP